MKSTAYEIALEKVAFGSISSAGHKSKTSFMRYLSKRNQARAASKQASMVPVGHMKKPSPLDNLKPKGTATERFIKSRS